MGLDIIDINEENLRKLIPYREWLKIVWQMEEAEREAYREAKKFVVL